MRTPLELIDLRTGQFVEAELFDDLTLDHFIETQQEWRPLVVQAAKKLKLEGASRDEIPMHWHWNWEQKEQQLGAFGITFYGIELYGRLEGLMKVDLAKYSGRLDIQKGEDLAYIDYLEVAPWNIKSISEALGRPQQYGPIGIRLCEAAVRLSLEAGYEGRVALHSIPLPRTERFYERTCKMTPHERDPKKENLLWFESTPQQAQQFLQEKPR